jgi:exodeoxyribonuclease V alpha subunit
VTGESVPNISDSGHPVLRDHIVLLQKNYRFGDVSPIFSLSKAVQAGDAGSAKQLFHGSDQLSWDPSNRHPEKQFRQLVIEGFRDYLAADDAVAALEKLNQFRILAALRYGPFGVSELNEHVEAVLHSEGMIDTSRRWYFGRPIMITRNDYNLGLFNGDIGMIAADAQTGQPQACFLGPDRQLRKLLPQRLPEHETVFALTIHKSQGSEFDDVLLVLPELDSMVLNRELIYTGITRAKRRVTLWATEPIFTLALTRQSHRNSGLKPGTQY